ncbi:hemolysin family protein [Lichenifustis flavocetrariae]|uniref:Hemolysin family protein n=1 Tax=Lichenifustis flavocetrariae TaxID=2949735 RepID=A0AA41YZI0_9HYPH|nr:hemolysin family protein [Lichenifustis flavocetrariae]MCW6506552.1 hemolysin family protein [Lichenifustis flavocetrariae]
MLELFIALVLILLNGVFAVSELAIVSSRRARLRVMADAGRRGAQAAMVLHEEPGRFLSTVQIGITLIGILAGAYSGAGLGDILSHWLADRGLSTNIANPLGYGLVVVIITYLSVVIGELVPKQLALREPEPIACAVAPTMRALAGITAPVTVILDVSTRLIFAALGKSSAPPSAVTEEELKTLVTEAATSGVIEGAEHQMIAGVLRLGDRSARAVMTPRTDVEWLDATLSDEEIVRRLVAAHHSRLPVMSGVIDDVVGVVQLRELLPALLSGEPWALKDFIREVPVIPDTLQALDVLNVLRTAPVPIVLVHDEYGHFEGLVTPADLLDAIAGAFKADEGENEPDAVKRGDGSWLLAGSMPVDEMAERFHITLPERRTYHTVAGFVVDQFEHLPATGESVEAFGWLFEVVDLDGRRIDKVLARKLAADEAARG